MLKRWIYVYFWNNFVEDSQSINNVVDWSWHQLVNGSVLDELWHHNWLASDITHF